MGNVDEPTVAAHLPNCERPLTGPCECESMSASERSAWIAGQKCERDATVRLLLELSEIWAFTRADIALMMAANKIKNGSHLEGR